MFTTGKTLKIDVENFSECLELDELYWFVGRKGNSETRERIQKIVDGSL